MHFSNEDLPTSLSPMMRMLKLKPLRELAVRNCAGRVLRVSVTWNFLPVNEFSSISWFLMDGWWGWLLQIFILFAFLLCTCLLSQYLTKYKVIWFAARRTLYKFINFSVLTYINSLLFYSFDLICTYSSSNFFFSIETDPVNCDQVILCYFIYFSQSEHSSWNDSVLDLYIFIFNC